MVLEGETKLSQCGLEETEGSANADSITGSEWKTGRPAPGEERMGFLQTSPSPGANAIEAPPRSSARTSAAHCTFELSTPSEMPEFFRVRPEHLQRRCDLVFFLRLN